MRVLLTGARGFAGGHLARRCAAAGAVVVGLGRRPAAPSGPAEWLVADLTDAEATRTAVRSAAPERVFHLAAAASVAESWRAPGATIDANVSSTLNLLEAVREEAPEARVLVACSGEEYGPVPPERLPVVEDEPLRPQSPYAVSKAAADLLAGFYADAHGLAVTRTRAFNHAGPGQSATFVVASLARQIAAAERAGRSHLTLRTGNLAARRDFTDVRDVVDAYWRLLDAGAAGVFNVCSGRAVAIEELLRRLTEHARVEVDHEVDPARLRPHEVPEMRGSPERLGAACGWEPSTPLSATLGDTLDWWRVRGETEE